jgi:hypothetical protein
VTVYTTIDFIINGNVMIGKPCRSIERGIKPTTIEKINQPILPTGLLNKLFIYEIPAALRTIRADKPQYAIKAGTNTHCPIGLYKNTARTWHNAIKGNLWKLYTKI